MSDAEIDEAVLAVAAPYWRKVAMIVASAARKLGLDVTEENLLPIGKRVESLVAAGALHSQGDLSRWRHSEIKLPAK